VIASVSGSVERSGLEGTVHLRCGPVTLQLALSSAEAAGLPAGEHATLHTSLQLSLPAAGGGAGGLRLYGFTTAAGRDLFELLLTASGVGPKMALALLELGAPGLARALAEGDEKTLTAAKGVGPKLAKKLVLELGEKTALNFAELLRRPVAGRADGAGAAAEQAEADAVEAVVALGFTRLQAEQALSQVREGPVSGDAAQLVRRMLAQLR
jgi:Holliday junction DNA helicase RuvA